MSNLFGQTLLNRYTVREFLGRGGMAEVYQVWDSQRMTFLAMKVLLEDLALDKVFIRRFTREADNLAKLQHPNIVRFFDFEKQDRLAFMLMDYIEGETLKHLIHDAPNALPVKEVNTVMQAVCGALHYAHNQGVVHCDIKPANIIIDKNGTVQLADFGIARMTDAATATMVGAGTPAYMAPEQIQGADPTPQTDIYALGIVLYEMLTNGERPFTGEQAQITGRTAEKVRWEQLNLSPPSPRVWNPSLSSALEKVVMKSLAKDPEARYQTVVDFRNALGLALGGVDTDEEGLGKKVRKRLVVSPTGQVSLPPNEGDERQPHQKGGSRSKVMLWVIPALLLVFGSFFLGSLFSSDKTTYPPTQDNAPLPVVEKTPTREIETAAVGIAPSEEVPDVLPTYTPFATITPLPPASNLSVEFVNPKYAITYSAKYPVLGELAVEKYSWDERSRSNITLPFTIDMERDQIVVWRWYWCATTQELLNSNMADFTPTFTINGDEVSQNNFKEISFTQNGQKCAGLVAALENWEPGKYELIQRISYDNEIYDGEKVYEPGSRMYIYSITVH